MIKKFGIWFLIIVFGLIYSLYSIVRHVRLESFIFDLGVYPIYLLAVKKTKSDWA